MVGNVGGRSEAEPAAVAGIAVSRVGVNNCCNERNTPFAGNFIRGRFRNYKARECEGSQYIAVQQSPEPATLRGLALIARRFSVAFASH